MGNVAATMAINMGASYGITSLVSAIGMVPSALGGAIGEELAR
jgi:fructose-specific phosphotransferase system IIC component